MWSMMFLKSLVRDAGWGIIALMISAPNSARSPKRPRRSWGDWDLKKECQ
jgi:hypothetical protein